MTRFRAGPRLDERVAARWAVPEARRLADQLANRVRANVPDAAVWICFAPDTRVTALGVIGVSRRVEQAELLQLTFRPVAGMGADRVLTVTTDHQILTTQGWVKAHRLKVGAYALGRTHLRGQSVVAPDEHDRPPTIAEVFRAAHLAAAARTEREVADVLNLDGDLGIAVEDGDVDVVLVDGVLRDELDAHARQVLPEWALGASDLDLAAALLGGSLRGQCLRGAAATADRLRSLADRLQRRLRVPYPAKLTRFAHRARRRLLVGKDPTHGRLAAAVAGSEHPLTEPFGVELCELVAVDVVSASCHVYDLLTEHGWLLADDIVAHNCARDERVRPTHVKADGQAIPDNLRYILDHATHGGQEMARAPRDPDLHIANRVNCRCISAALPGVIAEHVHAGDVAVQGARAHSTVSVSFSRIVESEHPGVGDDGGGWLQRSVAEVAAGRSRSV